MNYSNYKIQNEAQLHECLSLLNQQSLIPFIGLSVALTTAYLWSITLDLQVSPERLTTAYAVLVFFLLAIFLKPLFKYVKFQVIKHKANILRKRLGLLLSGDSTTLQENMVLIQNESNDEHFPIIRSIYQEFINQLVINYKRALHTENSIKLQSEYRAAQQKISDTLEAKIANHPLTKTRTKIDEALKTMKAKRSALRNQWELRFEKLSWWEKLNCNSPDFSPLDKQIVKLEDLLTTIEKDHRKDFQQLESAKHLLEIRANSRLNLAYKTAIDMLEDRFLADDSIDSMDKRAKTDEVLNYGLLGGALGISASVANQLYDAHNVFDALRNVNGNFSAMSDVDIWWECLWMQSDSLDGLINLTKGAYFEQLVAADTGGKLFEHFNHPDTDIVLDGIEVQLKATDSADYVNGIDEDIIVMATSEVAAQTDAIDSGISNSDISETVADSLGGGVVDLSDAAFAGLGGLGVFASMRGFNHTMQQIDKEVDTTEAIGEGLEIAIIGTAKGLVDASEFVYKIATSRPVTGTTKIAMKGVVGLINYVDKKLGQ